MKTLQIILAWLFIFPTGLLALAVGKTYLYLKHEAKEFQEIVIKQIK